MKSIGEFFKRIGGIHAREATLYSGVREALKEMVSIDVPISSIGIKSNKVILKDIPHSLRAVIFTKKAAIIERVNQIQSIRLINDIR